MTRRVAVWLSPPPAAPHPVVRVPWPAVDPDRWTVRRGHRLLEDEPAFVAAIVRRLRTPVTTRSRGCARLS